MESYKDGRVAGDGKASLRLYPSPDQSNPPSPPRWENEKQASLERALGILIVVALFSNTSYSFNGMVRSGPTVQ